MQGWSSGDVYRAVRAGVYSGLLAYYSPQAVTPAATATQHRRTRFLTQLTQARRALLAATAVFVVLCIAVLFLLLWWAATLDTQPGPPPADAITAAPTQPTQRTYSATQKTAFDF